MVGVTGSRASKSYAYADADADADAEVARIEDDYIVGHPGSSTTLALVPSGIAACLFDLDGVLTRTARTHAAAWQEMFDAYLEERTARTGEQFAPFLRPSDYVTHVDGKLRADGVRSFLADRGITLPE